MKRPYKKQRKLNIQEGKEQINWATFRYIGKQTRYITKVLKNIKTDYKTKNAIGNHLQERNGKEDKYKNAGVYKLKCKECTQYYIGQTGRSFNT
jgi:hypothetical protein